MSTVHSFSVQLSFYSSKIISSDWSEVASPLPPFQEKGQGNVLTKLSVDVIIVSKNVLRRTQCQKKPLTLEAHLSSLTRAALELQLITTFC